MTAQLSPAQVAARLALADYLETKVTDAEYDHSWPHMRVVPTKPCCAWGHAQRAGMCGDMDSASDIFGDSFPDEIAQSDAFGKSPSEVTRTEVIARLRECVEVVGGR